MSGAKSFENLKSDSSRILKSLRSNTSAGITSLAVFEQGNGENEEHRKSLHDLVSQRHAGMTFDHIMRSMLNLAVMDVSRMTDNPGTDRLSLSRLVRLVDGHKSDFENAALHWYDDLLGFPNAQAETSAAKVVEEWDVFHDNLQILQRSGELKRVRALRNNELAHSLGKSFQLPVILDIKQVLLKIGNVVSSASFALEGLEWGVDDYVVSRNENARTFWDCFGQ
ncbi:hypothetical protein [Hyphomonas oceanitis]|uniref:HEPN AbiU2-like domain-containing protein n=1 Tax=Hyphomonas oceanitis SCH89 TaxID=1280953 RepID=A0A059G7I3_9PROT|nr:hypothetical protein [Hyphomonas oceanitis]KDA02792.1 hypothetical protein HOC_08849 [Hyphomonas oceanitis SCH89]